MENGGKIMETKKFVVAKIGAPLRYYAVLSDGVFGGSVTGYYNTGYTRAEFFKLLGALIYEGASVSQLERFPKGSRMALINWENVESIRDIADLVL